jgi:hypothetical protein
MEQVSAYRSLDNRIFLDKKECEESDRQWKAKTNLKVLLEGSSVLNGLSLDDIDTIVNAILVHQVEVRSILNEGGHHAEI